LTFERGLTKRAAWSEEAEQMTLNRTILYTAAALALGASGACGSSEKPAPPASTPSSDSAATNTAPATSTPAQKDEAGPDNSQIMTRVDANGENVKERTWQSGPIEKVTVTTSGGTETARIQYRDGTTVETQDKNTIAHAMEWTGSEVASAGKTTGRVVESGSEKAADTTVDAAKTGAKKAAGTTKTAAEKTADTTKTAAEKTTHGAKKLGKALTP
jgi:ribonuclease E